MWQCWSYLLMCPSSIPLMHETHGHRLSLRVRSSCQTLTSCLSYPYGWSTSKFTHKPLARKLFLLHRSNISILDRSSILRGHDNRVISSDNKDISSIARGNLGAQLRKSSLSSCINRHHMIIIETSFSLPLRFHSSFYHIPSPTSFYHKLASYPRGENSGMTRVMWCK